MTKKENKEEKLKKYFGFAVIFSPIVSWLLCAALQKFVPELNQLFVCVIAMIITIAICVIFISRVNTDDLDEAVENLNIISSDFTIKKDTMDRILNIDQLKELENSVGDNKAENGDDPDSTPIRNIYVQTSKFTLEQDDFREIIIDNLRQGVVYNYLIPKENEGDFQKMVALLWKNYDCFLRNPKSLEKLKKQRNNTWSTEYIQIMEDAEKCKKETCRKVLAKKLFEIFKQRLKVSATTNISHPLTVVLYEVKNSFYKSIVKLPHDNENISEKYSYSIFGEKEVSSRNEFVRDFLHNFNSNELKTEELDNFFKNVKDGDNLLNA